MQGLAGVLVRVRWVRLNARRVMVHYHECSEGLCNGPSAQPLHRPRQTAVTHSALSLPPWQVECNAGMASMFLSADEICAMGTQQRQLVIMAICR